MPLDIVSKFRFDLPLDPELELLYFEPLGQGINLVHNHQDAVLACVYELVYLLDLAAFEVCYVNHVDYDGPAVDLLENVLDNLSPIELSNVICELHDLACF